MMVAEADGPPSCAPTSGSVTPAWWIAGWKRKLDVIRSVQHVDSVCGIRWGDSYLPAPLLGIYQTGGIKEVCPACERWANAEKDKMLKQNTADLKSAIRERADSFRASRPKPRWFTRIFSRSNK